MAAPRTGTGNGTRAGSEAGGTSGTGTASGTDAASGTGTAPPPTRTDPPRRAATRPTQRERSDATVEDLLTAARALFATEGYAATSLDAVCERAGVTKGALYHHFSGKKQLFSAVYTREQKRLAHRISTAYLQVTDPWEAVYEGSRAYLEASLDPEVQRITLFDAPGALGWEAMRDLGVNCRQLTLRGVKYAIETGAITQRPADPLTSMLYGGLSESAMAIVRDDDPRAALAEALTDLRKLFDALAAKG